MKISVLSGCIGLKIWDGECFFLNCGMKRLKLKKLDSYQKLSFDKGFCIPLDFLTSYRNKGSEILNNRVEINNNKKTS